MSTAPSLTQAWATVRAVTSSRLKTRLQPYVVAARRLLRDPPTIHEVAFARQRSFSQFGEDLFLINEFSGRADGFYVDVGAFHPLHFSNTYLLYKAGWRGINLEPSPDGLQLLRRYRPRDINLPYAVSASAGYADFVLSGTFAGLDDETHLWAGLEGERTVVQTRRLDSILREHLPPGIDIDVLDVDCEGHDLDVLESNDWTRFRPAVVLAEEHAQGHPPIAEFLASVGYRLRAQLDLTLVFQPDDR